MAVNPMMSSGVNGIQSGMRELEQTAREVAEFKLSWESGAHSPSLDSAADNPADAAEALVELKLYQRQVQASAKIVQTADEVIGFLLDVV